MTTYYTGIGSRNAPPKILSLMTSLATYLNNKNYILRSGGANGADSAFERGVTPNTTLKEIYLPWKNFNNNPSPLHTITESARKLASEFHPNWPACSPAARNFHSRNMYQVLGLTLNTPSKFIICWTPNATLTGGTAQALRLAISHNIPIYNLANPITHSKILLTMQKEETLCS